MNKSFLNGLLPSDEYKKTRILYFMAEALVVNVVLLFVFMSLYYFVSLEIDLGIILFLSSVLLIGYPYFRYILSGMEHTEISTEKEYKRTRKEVVLHAILSGIFFGIVMLVIKGIPNNLYEGMDYIFMSILFAIFYLLFDYISLRKSYNKNKELD
ncbi:hypothetical protein AB4G91_10305 [Macrococcoides goetzii]|uniref:hypothetical protein n=1 Tax=Macrococcus sp. PK TaxID=2801919 RepID=UPI001F117362|nr:hypothetical protein [Macrococcus sp. PK]MCH4985817.1 hypothetical protein [Macrococcus sp. PK]